MKNYEGKKAIIVDDDVDILAQLKLYLTKMGFDIKTCESQAEAEKIIEQENFDIALFDLMLENMDSGFILGYKIKKKNPGIPVLMITSCTHETGFQFDTSSENNRSWIKADVILDKDIRFEQLEREIQRLIS